MSIKTRLILSFLILAIIPAFLLSAFLFSRSVNYIKKIALADLNLLAEGKEGEVREFIEAKRGRAIDFTTDAFIRFSAGRINSLADRDERLQSGQILSDYLKANKQPVDAGLIEIHILDTKGIVIASTDPEFIGHNDGKKPYFTEGLKHGFVQGVDTHTHGGVEHRYIPIAAPIRTGDETVGVLMNGYGAELAHKLLSGERSAELGSKTSIGLESLEGMEIFLVDGNGYLFTPIKKMTMKAEPHKIETLPVRKCLAEGTDVNSEWQDVLGQTVWGASSCIRIRNGPVWTLVVEQDKDLALRPIEDLRYIFFIAGLGVVIVVGLTAWAVALSISRPIERLRKGTGIVAAGNLDYRVGSGSRDEIGALSRAFDTMTENLKRTTASRDEFAREVDERKKAEEALRVSENKYRNFVDNSLVGIYSTTVGGEIL
ncbi:MAG: HAMP domain-containing protein, partial [Deltaproteobacteria bacterium]|nr:HAMP domain-containing protein [Deltaproteobacteria bacterium]